MQIKAVEARKKRFTLIELLVVVAIIGILASMIIPSLSSARKKIRSSTCLNKLKQMAVAEALYGVDHDIFIPTVSADNQTRWQITISEYLNIKVIDGQQDIKGGKNSDSNPMKCPEN